MRNHEYFCPHCNCPSVDGEPVSHCCYCGYVSPPMFNKERDLYDPLCPNETPSERISDNIYNDLKNTTAQEDIDNSILQDLVELQEDPEAFKKKAAEVLASLDERSRSLSKKVSEGDNLITLEQLEILAKIVKPKEANWLFAPTDEELKILKLIRNAGSDGITQSEFINNFIPEESEEDSPATVFNRGVAFLEGLKSTIRDLELKGLIRVERTVKCPFFKCWIKEN